MNIWALWIPKTSDQFSAFPSVSKYLLHTCLHYILGDIPGQRKAGATISGSPRDSPSLWEKRPHMKHLYDSHTFTYNIMNDSLNCAARRGRRGHCVRAFLREVFQEDGELEFQKMVASSDWARPERQDVVSAGLVLKCTWGLRVSLAIIKAWVLGWGKEGDVIIGKQVSSQVMKSWVVHLKLQDKRSRP